MPPAPCIPEKEVRNLRTTAQRKAAFLRALGDSGSIAKSARVAGIDRTTHYEWFAKDPVTEPGLKGLQPCGGTRFWTP